MPKYDISVTLSCMRLGGWEGEDKEGAFDNAVEYFRKNNPDLPGVEKAYMNLVGE